MNQKQLKAVLLYIVSLIAILLVVAGCANPYAKAGIAYKVQETNIDFYDGSAQDPITARLELGFEDGNVSWGVSHHSQWFTGAPFNNDLEYSKTEIFLDYKFEL